ncbi:MAG: putative monovalent cation/H+ antiporter subunit A [Candidatus Promineifilaceae bacterium]|nr:putative monovalent cation/H+ antiporter subunit A [Candidatus Promineifilaceae bacterium]
MLTAILAILIVAALAPAVHGLLGRRTGWILAMAPLAVFAYYVRQLTAVSASGPVSQSVAWVPDLNVQLSFYFDGLSALMALVVSGIGALVVVYAGGYLAGNRQLGRFYAAILAFMASMLGLVTAGNALTLFVFWEMTSVTSFILIGFKHEEAKSRRAAMQALLVTGGGGLLLLAGLLLMGQVSGTLEMAEWLAAGDLFRDSSLYLPLLLLVLLGAFTKSAQVPFHFWLPGAMAAPAPVSAYLHSATMVKAGVYLLARLSPALNNTPAWLALVGGVGATTMLVGAYLALKQTDLKRILAYSTVSALGAMVMLIGLSLSIAAKAAVVFLLAHALYKGALFMAAGAVDHETGTRDITQLGGLRRLMPYTAVATAVAALSLAGVPALVGFIGKELLYEATLEASTAAVLFTIVAVVSNVLLVAVAGVVAVRPFFGATRATPKDAHEAPPAMWLGPAVLGGLGLLFGVAPNLVEGTLVAPAATALLGESFKVDLYLFKEVNLMLVLSALTLALGAAAYVLADRLRSSAQRVDPSQRLGPAQWYQAGLRGLDRLATVTTTHLLQPGRLDFYVLVIVVVSVSGIAAALFLPLADGSAVQILALRHAFDDFQLVDWLTALIIMGAALATTLSRSRLMAVVSLGVVGFGVTVIYALYSAPDLAMTQIAIETLTVILFVLVIYRLPAFGRYSSRREVVRDAVAATIAGGMMTLLTLAVLATPLESRLRQFFESNSLEKAKGANIVNVILVDFRGLDTLGEITVLAVAALGVYSLLKLYIDQEEDD